jgi:hypothetical protein
MKRDCLGIAVLCLAGATLVWSCGGKAVIDPGGSAHGGSGGTATTTTNTGSGGEGASATCDVLSQDLTQAIAAAQACDPTIYLAQCTGSAVVADSCACPIVANENYPELVQDALDAYNAWAGAGCGPIPCATCPPPPTTPWYCDPTAWRCIPTYVD